MKDKVHSISNKCPLNFLTTVFQHFIMYYVYINFVLKTNKNIAFIKNILGIRSVDSNYLQRNS